ncbi:MAG: aldo/keto reductase [Myxococcota bacterium]
MRTLTLRHSGLALSRIIAGGWQAGRDLWVGIDDIESIAALRAAFDAGVTTFDTAEDYGNGHSERILGRALGSVRDQIVIATKVSWDHLRRDQIVEACERSLRNLGTDHIDLYQVHWPAGTFDSDLVPLEETMAALVALKEQGKIRAIGVSNFDLEQLQHACRLAPVDTLQPPYSLLWRHAARELVPFCQSEEIAVLSYSPLAQGLLTGRITREHQFETGDNRLDNRLFIEPLRSRAIAAVEALRPIAQARGITLARLSLAWLTAQPQVCAIAGARNAVQAQDNANAGAVDLDSDTCSKMESLTDEVAQTHAHEPVIWTWKT